MRKYLFVLVLFTACGDPTAALVTAGAGAEQPQDSAAIAADSAGAEQQQDGGGAELQQDGAAIAPDSTPKGSEDMGETSAALDVQVQADTPSSAWDDQPGNADAAGDLAVAEIASADASADATAALPCDKLHPCLVGTCQLESGVCVGCLSGADCGPAAACVGQTCVAAVACKSDLQCKASKQVCGGGVCVDCTQASDCSVGQMCSASKCLTVQLCKSSKDCPAVCDAASGLCVACLSDADCEASQFCTATHSCAQDLCSGPVCGIGAVVFGCLPNGAGYMTAQSCDDSNPCTTDSCGVGANCNYVSNTGACNDGNLCTTNDFCAVGKCMSGQPLLCSDANPCTADSCEPKSGCNFTPPLNCDDGDACTVDACANGGAACGHTTIPGCCSAGSIVWSTDFDSGLPPGTKIVNSTGSPTKGWQSWNPAVGYKSPKGVLYYGNPKDEDYDFGNASGNVTLPQVALPAGGLKVAKAWLKVEIDPTLGVDELSLVAVGSAGSQILWTKAALGTAGGAAQLPAGWFEIAATIPAGLGSPVALRFEFASGSGQNNGGLGVLVDDVRIVVQCP